jgi:hypothetical protein
MVFKALRNTFTPKKIQDTSSRKQNSFGGVALIDPSENRAMKSIDIFSRNALEFINSANNSGAGPYSENQLLSAYLSSVYLYAAIRRVSNLMSRVKVVCEVQENNRWARLPETHQINRLFENEGRELLPRIWLNHAIYGSAMIYKVKTRRAILEAENGRAIHDYKDGAVAGLYVLDKPMWDVDEDTAYGKIKGFYVNQYDNSNPYIGGRSYLEREEVIYITDWNPINPNRGKSLVSVCIHEAVANAAIAQWMAEYFTRGAMPFIMVSMAEDDPTMMSDSDLRKYKRQFEEYWSGMGSSLRSVFMDRKVEVEQVGINAGDIAAPDLNQTALEGIAAVIGLDRELIVTPEGGSQERHSLLIKRAWEDSVIPRVEIYLAAINKDLGLPDNYRLVADLSGIAELEADRENKSSTETSIFESGLQAFNEARTRLGMPPIDDLEGWFVYDGKPMPIEHIIKISQLPPQQITDYAFSLWENNLAKKSEVLAMLGRTMPDNVLDGYQDELADRVDLIQSAWSDDLLTRSQVIELLGFTKPNRQQWEDGYRSELEKGKDYGDWITGLFDNNLLTRSQTIDLLDMNIKKPEDFVDGYSSDIQDKNDKVIGWWNDKLITRKQAFDLLGINPPSNFVDGYQDEVEIISQAMAERKSAKPEDLYQEQFITRGQALEMYNIKPPNPNKFVDGYESEVTPIVEAIINKVTEKLSQDPQELTNENAINNRQQEIIQKPLNVVNPQSLVSGSILESKDADNIVNEIMSDLSTNSQNDKSIRAAEEQLHEDTVDYKWSSYNPSNYGENVDIYPSHSLETESVDANSNYSPTDYYENFAIATDNEIDQVDNETIKKIIQIDNIKSLILNELYTWQKASLRNGKNKALRFEVKEIPQ